MKHEYYDSLIKQITIEHKILQCDVLRFKYGILGVSTYNIPW